jgi:hypothetical protein
LRDVAITSLVAEAGSAPSLASLAPLAAEALGSSFGFRFDPTARA